MQISIKGQMTLNQLHQALYESLCELESDFAVSYTKGATLYVNPTNERGEPVVARTRSGQVVSKIFNDGPYRCAADELKL